MKLYIDPGTGSMLFATLIGLVGLAGYFVKGLWLKCRFILSGGKKREVNESVIPFVIFSDDKRYWPVFEPICRELDLLGFETVYMTASPDDPALQNRYKHVQAEFIGPGNRAFVKLNFLKACIVLSTTPGLDVYQWKRSRDVKCYIHIPHMPSELTTYRMFGVDYYDTLLLSGQFQINDVRALEKLRGLPEKECRIVGIPYLDEKNKRLETANVETHERTVLVAPSWGSNSLLNRFGNKLLDQLISSRYHIIVRPHPQSFTSEKELIDRLMKDYPDLEWNRDVDNFEVLNRSDIMISDFSGVIFDYALVFDKPVICAYTDFDDSQYDAWWLTTPIWTATAIPRMGPILNESNLPQLKEMIDRTLQDQSYKESRYEIRKESWANRGHAANLVAKYIIEKYKELNAESANFDHNGMSEAQTETQDTACETADENIVTAEKTDNMTVSDSEHDSKQKTIKSYKKIIILIVVGVAWMAAVLLMRYNNARHEESELEHKDLAMMCAAENEAWFALETGQIKENAEYWFNNRGELMPVTYDKPEAYGAGTPKVGGGSKSFYKDGVLNYHYDEAQDYTDKIIKVSIEPEIRKIFVEWVVSP